MKYKDLVGDTMLVCDECGGTDTEENTQYYADGLAWIVVNDRDICPLCQREGSYEAD